MFFEGIRHFKLILFEMCFIFPNVSNAEPRLLFQRVRGASGAAQQPSCGGLVPVVQASRPGKRRGAGKGEEGGDALEAAQ